MSNYQAKHTDADTIVKPGNKAIVKPGMDQGTTLLSACVDSTAEIVSKVRFSAVRVASYRTSK